MQSGDHPHMDCTAIREALSARLDGEDPGTPATLLDRHLTGCAGCREWLAGAESLHRAVRVRSAEPVPDLTAAIVATATARGHVTADARPLSVWRQPISGWRWALFAVALTQLVLAGPALLLGSGAGEAVHAARELGAFDVALAGGLLMAAWQPARAWGLLPFAAVLAVVVAGTAVLDVFDGSTSAGNETIHLLELAGVALLWQVAREAGGRTRDTRRIWSTA